MPLKEWMVPQETQFFDLLESEAATVDEGAKALQDLLRDFRDVPAKRQRIKDIEHRADETVHALHDALNHAFVTPLPKEDLDSLASRLDDVLDYINAAATRIAIYEVDRPTEWMVTFGDVIVKATGQLRIAIRAVRDRQAKETVLACTIEVNRLENVGDDLLTTALGAILKDKDPIRVIKLKELHETLEVVTDRCEDVANVLEDIVVRGR